MRGLTVVLIVGIFISCNQAPGKTDQNSNANAAGDTSLLTSTTGLQDSLPPPNATKSNIKFSKVIGWPDGKTPIAPEGFVVTKFADGFNNPRSIYQGPNGDIFIAEANTESKGVSKVKDVVSGKAKSQNLGESSNRITLLRDNDGDGKAEFRQTFLSNDLLKPYGMLVIDKFFYVANTDGLWKYPYTPGKKVVDGAGQKILALPAGGYNNHWTRNLLAGKDNASIYISVGSGSNVGENGMENEVRRAGILKFNVDGSGEKVYASGLRNPVGMDWAPGTNTLWSSVNERDELGDDLVPDYLTSVKEGGFYGWPYAYIGQHPDPRMKGERQDLVKKSIVPDVLLGAHTASLGLAFYNQKSFPAKYLNGAFVGQHGSWNRSSFSGYKVVFVPFDNGKPSGKPEDFLTGFIVDQNKNEVYGRPVDVCVLKDGSMLVTDDAANTIWHIAYKPNK
ncbi:MAG: sorbosone dehydrogenase family protein [Chitinophagaceae bacterium]|nr:sorbosone dehydrogenase family protein [Chitinophagaceae bacterium]